MGSVMRNGSRWSCPSGDGSATSSPPWALVAPLVIPPTNALAASVEDEAMGCGSSAPSAEASSARRTERAGFLCSSLTAQLSSVEVDS